MLRGRYGIGWMIMAVVALVALAMVLAIWFGPIVAKFMAVE